MFFSEKVIQFYKNLSTDIPIPSKFSWIDPMKNEETLLCIEKFYTKYYEDDNKRIGILGINPGRFGAGVTGVPFTDPKILEEQCQINNPFQKRFELSAEFIYEMINVHSNITEFYKRFFISSICPIGFIANGKNCNYYDDKKLTASVTPFIINTLNQQIQLGLNTNHVFILGKGKNYKFFLELNNKEQFFKNVHPLPHPRWVMQYNRKNKTNHIQDYITQFNSII